MKTFVILFLAAFFIMIDRHSEYARLFTNIDVAINRICFEAFDIKLALSDGRTKCKPYHMNEPKCTLFMQNLLITCIR